MSQSKDNKKKIAEIRKNYPNDIVTSKTRVKLPQDMLNFDPDELKDRGNTPAQGDGDQLHDDEVTDQGGGIEINEKKFRNDHNI